jgi:hypothetical protein
MNAMTDTIFKNVGAKYLIVLVLGYVSQYETILWIDYEKN